MARVLRIDHIAIAVKDVDAGVRSYQKILGAELIEKAATEQRKPIVQIVNEALRRGLLPPEQQGTPGRYRSRPHQTALAPGIDADSFNQLADELEDEAVAAAMRSA